MEKQTTIAQSVSFEGIGLHTGNTSKITFHPADANHGYKFVRTDLENKVEIPALVDYVVDLSRGTTLGIDDVKVHTVEHVLAALAGLKIDNCLIELSANEPPVVDGSSMPYVEALQQAGIKQLDAEREYFEIDETISFSNDEKHIEIVALPNDTFRVTVMVDYFNPALGSQHTGLFDLEKEFVSEFAPARTFCFLTEVEMLRKNDLIKGGSLDSAIVIVDKDMNDGELDNIKSIFNLEDAPKIGESGILNDTPLRFKNEPARHKLLDMIGDMTLIGVPVKGQILAARPGHASNYEFSKLIRKKYLERKQKERYLPNKNKQVVMDIDEIKKYLPHRYPFLLVDRITHLDLDEKTIIGYKNVSVNEPFFPGHFPQKPVMPGVLICEAMAQVGGMLLLQEVGELNGRLALFMGIKSAKFRKPVLPGDQLVMEVKMVNKRFNTYWMHGVAMVNGVVAAESEFQVALVDGDL